MKPLHKSLFAGTASAVATYFASTQALGFTFALAIPAWVPTQLVRWGLWEALVVLGFGALLPAILIHLLAVRITAAQPIAAATAFAISLSTVLLIADQLAASYKTFPLWIIGALLASQFRK